MNKIPEFFAVRLDCTNYWDAEKLKELRIVRQWDVYVYDATRVNHCCELTPSYELQYVDFGFEMEDGASEEEIERAYDSIMEANNEAFDDRQFIYIHTSRVDAMELGKDRKALPAVVLDEEEDEDIGPLEDPADYNELMASFVEDVRCNALW